MIPLALGDQIRGRLNTVGSNRAASAKERTTPNIGHRQRMDLVTFEETLTVMKALILRRG